MPHIGESERNAYMQGYRDGLAAFAWWKDGEQYVGTCGATLKQALEKMERGELWNQQPS